MSRIFLIMLFCLPLASLSQSGFRIGWAAGTGNAREINRVIHSYNSINSLDKNMGYVRSFGGVCVSYIYESFGGGAFEMKWQNRHRIVKSQWTESGDKMTRHFKFRSNQLSFGGYGPLGEGFYAGGSFDFGNFNGYTRKGSKNEIRETNYEQMFNRKDLNTFVLSRLQLSNSVYFGYQKELLGIRLTYQWQYMNMYLHQIDYTLLGSYIDGWKSLKDRFSNIGIEIYLKIGGSD
jgi:hypothetical protein